MKMNLRAGICVTVAQVREIFTRAAMVIGMLALFSELCAQAQTQQQLTVLGSMAVTNTHPWGATAVVFDHAFVAAGTNGLIAYNIGIADPAAIVPTVAPATAVWLHGETAYVVL